MSAFAIRPMTPADVPVAVGLARAEGWHDRTRFFEVVLRTTTCSALVGEVDGRVVATGMSTVNGPVGWLGGLIVDSKWRRRGYGRAMTEELIRRLLAAGCRTLSLEATDEGRPMYERMGFRLETRYHQLEAGHLTTAPEPPRGARLRPLELGDLPALVELDRQATAEDRSEPLRVLAEMNSGWVLERWGLTRTDASLAGFLLPSERAYGAIVAPRFEDGLFLLELHRAIVHDAGTVRAGIPHEHRAAWSELENRGWVETWQAPRMLLGEPIDWRPEWIWGQINSAMG